MNVVFVLYDLSTWKTELLYLAMLEHKSFNPILAITTNTNLKSNDKVVEDYCVSKGYCYTRLDENRTICSQIKTDIILYQRPYDEMPLNHTIQRNLKAVLIHFGYGFHGILEDWVYNTKFALYSWQYYYENELCVESIRKRTYNNARNRIVTGIPMMDEMNMAKENFANPWKDNKKRKRIIWAPHHSIGNIHMAGLAYGTFLDIADGMLQIAKDYSEQIFIAFKPHPVLYKNLITVWGKDRTDKYYHSWDELENGQLESGLYTALFLHSDAMIHDCATFTQEYMITGKPVLYMMREEHQLDNIDDCMRQSFDLHYHGENINDIKNFINNVINDVDPRVNERLEFKQKYLIPPHGKTACENVMNAILGIEEYK